MEMEAIPISDDLTKLFHTVDRNSASFSAISSELKHTGPTACTIHFDGNLPGPVTVRARVVSITSSKYFCDALPATPPFGTGPLRLIHRSLSTWMWLRRALGRASIAQGSYKPPTRTHDRTSNPPAMCKVAIRRVHNNIHHCYTVN